MKAGPTNLENLCEMLGLSTVEEDLDRHKRSGSDEVYELSAELLPASLNGRTEKNPILKLADIHQSRLELSAGFSEYQEGEKKDPFGEIGQPGTPILGGQVRQEPTAKYGPYQVRGYAGFNSLYEQYYRQEPILFEGINEGNNIFASGRLSFQCPDVPISQKTTAEQFTEFCNRWFNQMWRGPQYFQRHLGAAKVFGFYGFEIVWGYDTHGRIFPKKFAPREPSTVDRWIMNHRGDELMGVIFQTTPVTSSGRAVATRRPGNSPGSKDTRYTLTTQGKTLTDFKYLLTNINARANNFEGIGYPRPVLHWCKFKQVLAQIAAISAQKYGVPVPFIYADLVGISNVQADAGIDIDDALNQVANIQSVDGAAIRLPAGVRMELLDAQGTMPDLRNLLDYCDHMIERVVASEAAGLSSGTVGSYALASVLDNRMLRSQPGFALEVTQSLNWLVRDIAAHHDVYLDDYPVAVWQMDGFADSSKWIEDATKAMAGLPLWEWPEEMKKQALYKLDLDPTTFDEYEHPEQAPQPQQQFTGAELSAKKPHAVIFVGMPASGKTTFYRENFSSYEHVNQDTIQSRAKEEKIIEQLLLDRKNLVIDNTNATTEKRKSYIEKLKTRNYKIDCYYFDVNKDDCIERNKDRENSVPKVAIHSIAKSMEAPSKKEGFDNIFVVSGDLKRHKKECGCSGCQIELAPKKYDHINYTPPKDVADAAEQGLSYRDEYGRGGTDVGVARARDLSNRVNVSPETIRRMNQFFSRHEKNRTSPQDETEPDGGPKAGWIAWLLWGGDAGKRWASKVLGQMDAADENQKELSSTPKWLTILSFGAHDETPRHEFQPENCIDCIDERGMSVEKIEEQLNQKRDQLAREINPIISEMQRYWRANVRDRASDPVQAEIMMRAEFLPRLEDAFLIAAQDISNESKKRLLRDYGFTVARDAQMPSRDRFNKAMRAVAHSSASEAFNRQYGRMLDSATADAMADEDSGVPKLKMSTLAAIATGVVNISWSAGRDDLIETAIETAKAAGEEPQQITCVRSSMLDNNVCPVCKSLDFQEGGHAYVVGSDSYYSDMPPLRCEGEKRCRCAYIYRIPEMYKGTLEQIARGQGFTLPPGELGS